MATAYKRLQEKWRVKLKLRNNRKQIVIFYAWYHEVFDIYISEIDIFILIMFLLFFTNIKPILTCLPF